MYLDPKSLIAGIPALQVRDFLKPLHNCQWTKKYLAQHLNLSDGDAERLILSYHASAISKRPPDTLMSSITKEPLLAALFR